MNHQSYRLLGLYLGTLHTPNLAVVGDPTEARDLVETVLTNLNRSFSFVAAETMPSTKQLVRRRAEALSPPCESEIPTFMRTFLESVGIENAPEVLIVERFNSRPSAELDYVKTFLDTNSREADEIYQRLKYIILTLQPSEMEGSFPIDPSIRSCIWQVITLGKEAPETV